MKRMKIAAATVALLASGNADATTFNFTFRDIGGGGTGTLAVEKILTAGTYKLSEVGAYSLNFTVFGGFKYTNDNIKTTPATVLLIVSGEAGTLTMLFSNTQSYGDGPRNGSLDLIGSGNFMAFAPPAGVASTGPDFYTVGPTGRRPFLARYSAVEAVPEPATWGMMLLGFGMIASAVRYRRRTTKAVYA